MIIRNSILYHSEYVMHCGLVAWYACFLKVTLLLSQLWYYQGPILAPPSLLGPLFRYYANPMLYYTNQSYIKQKRRVLYHWIKKSFLSEWDSPFKILSFFIHSNQNLTISGHHVCSFGLYVSLEQNNWSGFGGRIFVSLFLVLVFVAKTKRKMAANNDFSCDGDVLTSYFISNKPTYFQAYF